MLVCARATKEVTISGSSFNRTCGVCGERVMIAPSGQRLLRDRPGTPVVCEDCVRAAGGLKPEDEVVLPDERHVIRRELDQIEINNWSKRN